MIPFAKMHGIGNDFVVVDAVLHPEAEPLALVAASDLCDRRFGVGADGVIVIGRGEGSALRMRMANPDGTEAEMCGNGVRCVALYAVDRGLAESPIALETAAGTLRLEVVAGRRVRVDMGPYSLRRADLGMHGESDARFVDEPVVAQGFSGRGTAVSMGNPHLVFFVDDVASVPLDVLGPMLERHDAFPNRVNVHFATAETRRRLRQRTWERGAGATLACGTGACAVAVAGHVLGLSDACTTVALPGGELEIDVTNEAVYMTGPAVEVFQGVWNPAGS